VSFAHRFSCVALARKERGGVRDIGLDVHRDFCEVAIAEAGAVRSAGRIETTPEAVELFAASLGVDDRVALKLNMHGMYSTSGERSQGSSWTARSTPRSWTVG
jgi:hypothetical protein